MIVGIIGDPRVGKDEVANFLVKYYNFKKIAFADQIKKEYFIHIGITIEDFEELKKNNMCHFIRNQLWEYSNRIKEIKGQDYFIKTVLDKINNDNWVITDIRTKLELECVLEKNIKILVIKKDNLKNNIIDSELTFDDIREFDVIMNDKETIDKFEENLQDFFRRKLTKLEDIK